MDKLNFKKQVLAKAKEEQRKVINDFRNKIEELKGSETNREEDQADYGERSLDETTNEVISRLADELNFCLAELDVLNQMEVAEPLLEEVRLGAIVKTDKGVFYPSVSIEKFEVNGNKLFGLSTKAPLYKEMMGKKKGEEFSYNDNTYKITEVY